MKKYLFPLLIVFLLGGCAATENIQQNVTAISGLFSGETPEKKQEKEKAEEVAVNFTKQFLTLKGRANNQDVGGLEYVDPDIRELAKQQALNKFFFLYDKIEKGEGLDSLPAVSHAYVSGVTQDEVEIKYPHYILNVTVDYESTSFDFNEISVVVGKVNNTWVITGIHLPNTK
jgi:hypothetical protein